MRLRLRTAWLEIAAGFHLLFAAFAMRGLGGTPSTAGVWGVSSVTAFMLTFLAACGVFLLHPTRGSRGSHRAIFLGAGIVAAFGAAWFAASGDVPVAVLQVGYAIWLLGASFLPGLDRTFVTTDEASVKGFNLLSGLALVAVGVLGLTGVARQAPLLAATFVAAGAAIVAAELLAARYVRVAVVALGAPSFLALAAAGFARGDVGSGSAMLAVFGLQLVSAVGDVGLPEVADDLSGTTPRQREIYAYERAGEMSLWAIAALSSVFIDFVGGFDERLYFAAILSVAFVTQYNYRMRPAKAISERRYLTTLIVIIFASILFMVATGGARGPFVSLTYLAIFAGTIVVSPIWSLVIAGVYALYVLAELAWRGGFGQGWLGDERTATYLFMAATILITGMYTAWSGRRRMRAEETILAANRRLAEALRNAVSERERYERQARDLQNLNENLLEMRSALMNVLEDVEESKRQIDAERRREVASFNALAEGVVVADKDRRIFLCNPTAARILGVPTEAVIGQSIERILRFFHADDVVMQTGAFDDAYAGRTAVLGERLRLARVDGSFVPVSGNVAPYLDEENRAVGVVAAFRDVTIEREIDRQKSDFISIASHQLRTPLSALRWCLDLLLAGDVGPFKLTQREYLSDMSASVLRMIKLVGDLLNISRIESGRTKPTTEDIDARAFVDSLVREFMPLVRQQEVALTSVVAKDVGTFYADSSMARQALSNLIDNALKYTPSGGSVAIDVKTDGVETVFTVKDTGLGIPKAQQYRIFDKFFRGENVVARETVGSGLGLYVVKSIVELSGGRVWFESSEKKGTAFHLSLLNRPPALPGGAGGGILSA